MTNLFDTLTEQHKENVLRVSLEAESRPEFCMSRDEVVGLMMDFGGLDDPSFIVPRGITDVWKGYDHPVQIEHREDGRGSATSSTLGAGRPKRSEETKRKMSEAAKRRWAAPGARAAQSARLRRSK